MFAIQTHNLKKDFANKQVLKGIDLAVPEQSVFGFLGNNGAGKSTLIKTLLGLLNYTGSIEIAGKLVLPGATAYRAHIGALVDSPSLYQHLTPAEYLKITQIIKQLPKSAIDDALSTVDMLAEKDHKIEHFSLGMKQRIALAQALMGRPRLLILDEPTNGLDPAGMAEIRQLLASLPQKMGVTVFLSSHLLDEIEKTATHVAILKDGKIALQSELSQLLALKGQTLQIRVSEPEQLVQLLDTQGISHQVSKQVILVPDCKENDAIAIHQLMYQASLSVIETRLVKDKLEDLFHLHNRDMNNKESE